MTEYVADEEFCHPLGVDVLSTGDEERCLSAIMVGDGKDGIIVPRPGEFSDEVHRNHLKGESSRCWEDRVQGRLGRASIDLVSLAFRASSDILYDVLSKSWPPVGPLY